MEYVDAMGTEDEDSPLNEEATWTSSRGSRPCSMMKPWGRTCGAACSRRPYGDPMYGVGACTQLALRCTLRCGMLIKCEHCGAPLDVDPNERTVQCQFCKYATRVEQQPPAFGPAPMRQPPNFAPRPPAIPPQPQRKGGCLPVGVLASVIAMAGVGVASFVVLGSSSSSSVTGTTVSTLTGPKAWNTASGSCFLDANGDGVFDVAGLTGKPGSGTTPTIIDGKTGDVIWTGQPSMKKARSACAGDKWLVVSRPDFRIEFHDARKPEVPVKYMASDKLQGLSLGKGCVKIQTKDRTVAGVALPGGTATKCDDAPKPRRLTDEFPGIVGLTDDGTKIKRGSRTYGIKKRKSGTKILTVEVTDSGKTLWSKELPYQSPTFNTAIAVGRGMVMVWAASPVDNKKAILVGLDEKTGTQKYEKPQKARVTNTIEQFQFNGRYLIAMYWAKLYAYEPKTGEIVWTIGR